MDTVEAEALAKRLLAEFELDGEWHFSWDRSVRRFGVCRHRNHQIGLSKPLTELNTVVEVEDVIRHEIAHALAGHEAGHGLAWVAKCYVTGARPERCYESENVVAPPAPWRIECPCGMTATRHRRPRAGRGPQVHTACGNEVRWVRNL